MCIIMICFNLDLFAIFPKSAGEFYLCDALCMRSYLMVSACSITNRSGSECYYVCNGFVFDV